MILCDGRPFCHRPIKRATASSTLSSVLGLFNTSVPDKGADNHAVTDPRRGKDLQRSKQRAILLCSAPADGRWDPVSCDGNER